MTNTRITDPEILERRYRTWHSNLGLSHLHLLTRLLPYSRHSSSIRLSRGIRRPRAIPRRQWCHPRNGIFTEHRGVSSDRTTGQAALWASGRARRQEWAQLARSYGQGCRGQIGTTRKEPRRQGNICVRGKRPTRAQLSWRRWVGSGRWASQGSAGKDRVAASRKSRREECGGSGVWGIVCIWSRCSFSQK